ncbi:MAG: phasin family protein [Acidiferrobacterales bacterium]
MYHQVLEKIEEFGQPGFELAKRLGAFQVRLWDKLAAQQLEVAELWVGVGIKQLRLLAEAQGPYDVFAGQSQLAQECVERAMEQTRRGIAALVQQEFEATVKPVAPEAAAANREAPASAKPTAAAQPATSRKQTAQ